MQSKKTIRIWKTKTSESKPELSFIENLVARTKNENKETKGRKISKAIIPENNRTWKTCPNLEIGKIKLRNLRIVTFEKWKNYSLNKIGILILINSLLSLLPLESSVDFPLGNIGKQKQGIFKIKIGLGNKNCS